MTANGGRLSESAVLPASSAVAKRSSRAAARAVRNAMTVDVEDYFQVQAFAHCVERSSWETMPRRVESNTEKILTLFAEAGTKATFFVLGWIAERHPALIRRIVDERHELASHGYSHVPVREQKHAEFRADVSRTKKLLEDIGGAAVRGYRAASFSIDAETLWAYDVLGEEGYQYSSSIYPIHHDLYGMPEAPRFAFRLGDARITELPMTTLSLFGKNLPCAGGGYFRLLPYSVSRWALRHVNARDRQPAIFYFHPWEIDTGQPVFATAGFKSRFRHYHNLRKTETRLRRLLDDFDWGRMDQVFLDGGGRTDRAA